MSSRAFAISSFSLSDVVGANLEAGTTFDALDLGVSLTRFSGIDSSFRADDDLCEDLRPGVEDSVATAAGAAASSFGVFEDLRACLTTGSCFTTVLGGSTTVLDRMLENDMGSTRAGFVSSTGFCGAHNWVVLSAEVG